MQNKCSILINSCDNYEEIWSPFFYFLKKNWKNIPFPIYFNTETKTCTDNQLEIKTINYKRNAPWGERLINALNNIDSDYVLFMLDDYLLLNKVDETLINKSIEYLDKDETISVFYLRNSFDTKNDYYDGTIKEFLRRPDKCKYKLNCQVAIWRRKKLISYIRKHESPWDFEILGSKRATRYKDKFYILAPEYKPPFIYDFLKYGLIRGKWSIDTPSLFKENGIEIDYTKRGFYNYSKVPNLPLIKKLHPSYIWMITKRIVSEKIKEIKSLS